MVKLLKSLAILSISTPTFTVITGGTLSSFTWVDPSSEEYTQQAYQSIYANFGYRDKSEICENQNRFVDHRQQAYFSSFCHSFNINESNYLPLTLTLTPDVIKDMVQNSTTYSIVTNGTTSVANKTIRRTPWTSSWISTIQSSINNYVTSTTGEYYGSPSSSSSLSISDQNINWSYTLFQNDTSTWSPYGYDAEKKFDYNSTWSGNFNVKYNFDSLKVKATYDGQGNIKVKTSRSSSTPFVSVIMNTSKAKSWWSGECGGNHWAGAWHKATWGGLGGIYSSYNWTNLSTSGSTSIWYNAGGDVDPQSGWYDFIGYTDESQGGWIQDKHWWYGLNPSSNNKITSYSVSDYTYNFNINNPLLE